MGSLPIRDLLAALEGTAKLLVRWGLKADEWCLLDGPAIKLHDSHFDSRAWRDHLNVYVNEQALPWPTREFELTVPPLGSAELDEILELARGGTQIHLVPAWRYYTAGFERKPVGLPSGRSIEAATLRGCSQVWSYKSAEIVDKIEDFEGDLERIVEERLVRLRAALAAASEADARERILLLESGYEALRRRRVAAAREIFMRAAGTSWTG